jgi:hypothetical protein
MPLCQSRHKPFLSREGAVGAAQEFSSLYPTRTSSCSVLRGLGGGLARREAVAACHIGVTGVKALNGSLLE